MKHIVFDNGLRIMADLSSGVLRVRRLEALSLLISREDFLSAAIRAHPPSRRSRSVDGFFCALKGPTLHDSDLHERNTPRDTTNQHPTRERMLRAMP
jgi:hypothetical protein